ncbi:MAG: hypothetical protein AB7O04_14740 [Hyphomonadaceae bacterium]
MLQHHMQETYRYLFDEAHSALNQAGSFRPFGAGTRKTGEQIQTLVDQAAAAGPQDHIRGLIAGFREDDKQNGLIAAGLVFDGQMGDANGEHSRALVFHLEAANGRAVEVVVPYVKHVGDIFDFGEPVVTEVQPEIFLDAAQP